MTNRQNYHRYAPKKHRDWIDWIGTVITGATLFIAICAAVAAGLAARFTYGQWGAAAQQASEAHAQTQIQRGLNRAYFIGVLSPVGLGATINVTRDSIDKKLVDDHIFSPGIRIGGSGVICVGDNCLIYYGFSDKAENIWVADINVTGQIGNFGGIPALVERGSVWAYIGVTLPKTPIYKEGKIDEGDGLQAGPHQIDKSLSFPTVIAKDTPIKFSQFIRIASGDGKNIRADLWTKRKFVFIYAVIRYVDRLAGGAREYGFGWRWSPTDDEFEEAGGKEYNFDRNASPQP